MSLEEVEKAILLLSPEELDRLDRRISSVRHGDLRGSDLSEDAADRVPRTLADAMGPLLGILGNPAAQATNASRDAGAQLSDHLVAKKLDRRL